MSSHGFRFFVLCCLFAIGCFCVLGSAQRPAPANPAPSANPDDGQHVPSWVRALQRA